MKKWVINADDFGYSKGVNYGIIEAYKEGVVSSATLMMNMPGADHAIELAKENKSLGVGIHLVLTCGRPIREDVPSLVNESGEFHNVQEVEKYATIEDVEKEWTSQIELFYSQGLIPTHLDSHHHVHMKDKFYPVIKKLAKEYNLPIRGTEDNVSKLHPIEHFCNTFYGDHLTIDNTITLFESLLQYNSVEVMCHPAYIDMPIQLGSSYTMERIKETTILTSHEIITFFKENEIQLVNYKNV